MTTDSIGWWITHPPEPIRGRMVSDRYLFNRFRLAAAERGEPYEGQNAVWPPELEETIRPLVLPHDEVRPDEMQQFIDGDVVVDPELKLHAVEDELRIVYAKDESTLRIAHRLLDDGMPDLFCVYVQGTDVASHYFWKYRWPEEWTQKFGETIPPQELRTLRRRDRRLLPPAGTAIWGSCSSGSTSRRRPSSCSPITASSRASGTSECAVRRARSPASTARRSLPAFCCWPGRASGPARPSRVRTSYDIAPTVLSLLGLPVASDMDGKVLEAALDEGARANGARQVASYETPSD